MAPRADGLGEDDADHVSDAASPAASPHEPSVPTPADEPHEPTDDERWAAIVAELADVDGPVPGSAAVSHPVVPWVSDPRVVRPAEGRDSVPPELRGRDWDGTDQIDDAEAAVDAEEHYVPPDPGPVLGGDPLLTMAWFATVGIPLFFVVLLVAWRDAPTALIQAAGAVLALGVAVLVWRMPNHRRDASDDDHGAVV